MALMSGTVEQVGRSVVVPKTPLLPNNSLNQTRPLLSACVMLRQIAFVACSQVGTWARRLAQKGWHVANKLAFDSPMLTARARRMSLATKTTFQWQVCFDSDLANTTLTALSF